MKKQTLLSVIIMVGLLCCSCARDSTRNYQSAPFAPMQDTITPVEAVPPVAQPEKAADDVTEKSESDIPQKDDVLVYPLKDFEIIDTFDESMYSVFAVTQNDGSKRNGIIDIYGNIRVAAEYESVGWCGMCEMIYAYKEYPETVNYPIYIDNEYSIEEHWGHGGGRHWAYILDCKTNKMYSLSSSEGGAYTYEVTAMPAYTPYIKYNGVYPVEFDEDFYGALPSTPESEANFDYYGDHAYALYDTFLYGLTDKDDLECEFRNSSNEVISLGKCSIWYSEFTNDYLRVKRNGKYGFVDKNGKDASEFIYENAEEAYDGKAWVKLDGKWQVIKLR